MSLRTRILFASLVLVWVPLLLLGIGVRVEMSRRLTDEYTRRVDALLGVTRTALENTADRVGIRLEALAERLAEDNRFRLAAVNGLASERAYLVDYAGSTMGLLDLDMLQIQDEEGRIMSSGHFRNLHDHMEPSLPWYLEQNGEGLALAEIIGPEDRFLALVRSQPLTLGSRRFVLVGGVRVDDRFLEALVPDQALALAIESVADAATQGK